MTSSFPLLHPKVTFWKGSNIQRLHLQPVRSTECSSKGWTTKTKPIQVTRVNFQIIRVACFSGSLGPSFSYRCKFHTRSRSLQAADLDNQQDWASSAKFCICNKKARVANNCQRGNYYDCYGYFAQLGNYCCQNFCLSPTAGLVAAVEIWAIFSKLPLLFTHWGLNHRIQLQIYVFHSLSLHVCLCGHPKSSSRKGHQFFLLLIAEMVWVWLKALRWAAVQKREREVAKRSFRASDAL